MSYEEYDDDDDLNDKSFGESSSSSSGSYEYKVVPEKNKPKNKPKNVQKKENKPQNNQNNLNNQNIQNEDYNDLIKCYICLNPSISPVICRFCGNIACRSCFTKWVNTHFKCGCCRKNMTSFDLISPPIIGKINNYLKDIQNKKELDQCLIHKEKILFFCVNCIKKYCGKCLAFNNEESKKHIGHKILDYSEIKNSQYNELINKLDSAQEITQEININSKIYDIYKIENKIKFMNSISAIDTLKDLIFKKFEEKNNLITNNTENLIEIKERLNENYKYIYINLQKIEKIEKPIENFNVEKNCQKLKNEIDKVKEIENQIEKIQNNNNEIEFKTFNFSVSKNKKEIMKSKNKIIIKSPIYLEIQTEDESYFSIIIPKIFEKKEKIKKNFFLIPMVNINSKIYEFRKIYNKDINNSMDSEEDEEEAKKKNNLDFINYKSIIKLNELKEGDNKFNFTVYGFSIY